MSWSIHASGTVDEVRRHVEEERCWEQRNGITGSPNEAQFERAKTAILAELDHAPLAPTGDTEVHARLEAAGHSDTSSSYGGFKLLVEFSRRTAAVIQRDAELAGSGVG
jgi:hypothetical protein